MTDSPRVEIYTKEHCPYCDKVKALFDEKGVEYETINVTGDEDLFEEMVERADGRQTAPEVFVDDELVGGWDETSALDATGELDEKLGIASDEAASDSAHASGGEVSADGGEDVLEHREMIISGTGIAGLTAAIYAARSNNEPLVIEGDEPGGQLTLTTDVENYPGFPDGISGPDLINDMKEQATKFGADTMNGIIGEVVAGDPKDGTPHRVVLTNGDAYATDTLIAASGASARTLEVPGEDTMMGYGLSTCATCDGAFFRDEDMLVVGGGDAAMEEANFLTKFADTVYVAHRREEFRAEDIWIDRVMDKVDAGEIEILKNTELTEIHGTQAEGVDHVTLVTHPEGYPKRKLDAGDDAVEEFEMDVGAVFYAIGHTPNTEYLQGTGVEMDDEGYLQTEGGFGGGQTKTGVPGIYGAGDVVDFHYQQAVTAAGMGCKAALDADDFLEALERSRANTEVEGDATAEADD